MKTPATVVVLLLVSACGRTMVAALDAQSALPPPDAFQCVMKAFEAEGFKRTSYDKEEMRTTARRVNPKIRISNVQFQKAYDILEVDIAAGTDGQTELDIVASTAAELFTQRGPELEAMQTTAEARAAARTIAELCAGSPQPST